MERSTQKKLVLAVLGVFSGAVLIMGKGDISWLQDEIFAIIVSLIFIGPVMDALFELRMPKEYIVVFVIGVALFVGYSYVVYNFDIHAVIGLLFMTILFTAIGSVASEVVKWLEKIIPPN